ncbi:MAG: bifunctional diguanylate cyclase/phosphodiesterase [Actinomycetales bacterium]|nr:bifunctional diguanylate cyclase/phosphodiesterase [Actinomycetales bacterium]
MTRRTAQQEPPTPGGVVAARLRAVTVFAYTVFAVGLLFLVLCAALQLTRVSWASWEMSKYYLLTVLLVIGEMRPLLVARHDGEADRITVSTIFSVALALIGPVTLVLLAQAIAVGLDDLRRRMPLRTLFNIGQYLVTLTITRLVFALSSGNPVMDPATSLDGGDVLPALLAAATFFLLNNGLVSVIVALETGQSAREIFREDIRVGGLTWLILLGLAPVAAVVAEFSLFMLPLMMLPVLGVQHNAWIAALRQHEALHDGLTGLPNRELLRIRAERAIAHAGETGQHVGVMLLDLDHFKEVNDTLGHHVGDGLLREVARRVTDALPAEVTVARLGGDEFAVLVPGADEMGTVGLLAERVADRLRESVHAEGVRIGVQASIGIAVFPQHATTMDTLLQRADIALYRAKTNRGEIQIYRPEIDQHTVLRLSLLGDLHQAVDNEEFEVLYQPQVEARTGRPVAVEALMRWRHPVHGVISPEVFIPLAENSGAIGAMSRTAVQAALTTLAMLRIGGHDVSMAVNISARLLSDLELPDWLRHQLIRFSIPSSRVTIEVTESTITADPKRAMQVLRELREIGVRLAVDDFGTGYSSLSYLRRLKPDELKVDKSFVLQMGVDENSEVIVRSTVDLGHGLGLSVVAEGVEDQETYDRLARLGCDLIQGFHVARPMTYPALQAWLDAAVKHRDPFSRRKGPQVPRARRAPAHRAPA